MCYTSISLLRNQNKTLDRFLLLNQICNAITLNTDGAAIRNGNTVVRELDNEKFIDYVLNNPMFGLVHLHLRAATSKINDKSIHLWKIGGAWCAHNGVLPDYQIKKHLPDSYKFFLKIEKQIRNRDVEGIAKELSEAAGYAVITISYPDNSFIIGSMNKPVEHLIVGDSVVFASDYMIEHNNNYRWQSKWNIGVEIIPSVRTRVENKVLNNVVVLFSKNAEQIKEAKVNPKKIYSPYSSSLEWGYPEFSNKKILTNTTNKQTNK